MCVADDLCTELFRYIEQQEKCADSLEILAKDLEQRRGVVTTAQSAFHISAGFVTKGLAAPLLVTEVGIGTATSINYTFSDDWKAGITMENAEKCAGEIESIWKEIERLQKQLTKECESQNPEDIQCEIAANILSSMAKRNGGNLSITRLYHLLKNYDMPINIFPELNLGTQFLVNVGALLGVLGLNLILKPAATTGAKYVPLVLATEQMAALSLKTVLKGTGQLAGGAFGLILTLPDLVKNCEDLIEHNDQTEASRFLRAKANEIRDAVKSINKQLNELQEMINEIPETKCDVKMLHKMCGDQKYTEGTLEMEYKWTQETVKKQHFIFLSTIHMTETENSPTRRKKLDGETDENKLDDETYEMKRKTLSQTSGSQISAVQQSRSYKTKSAQKSSTTLQMPPFLTTQDETRHDTTRHGKTRHDKTRHDKTRHDKTRRDKTRQDETRRDETRRDTGETDKTDKNKIQIPARRDESSPQPESNTILQPLPDLPSITMSNLNSLPNKLEEIKTLMENNVYFASDLMCFTETWLKSKHPPEFTKMTEYNHFRCDRDQEITNKIKGGGLLMFVKEKWSASVEMDVKITRNYELMDVKIRPEGHPEDAQPFSFVHVYAPGKDFKTAASEIAERYNSTLHMSKGSPAYLLGDFNQCDFSGRFNEVEQLVTCLTRKEKILDMCFVNQTGAYSCLCSAPVLKSDHNVIHLIPNPNKKTNLKCQHEWKSKLIHPLL